MAIRRHHQTAAGRIQNRTVVALLQRRVIERVAKQLVDELGHRPATPTVSHFDASPPHIQGAQIVLLAGTLSAHTSAAAARGAVRLISKRP